MFLKKTILKKLMKNAYKGIGLTVGKIPEQGQYISGGFWTVWFREGWMPKEIAAQVMELCGELPKENMQFTARCDEETKYDNPDGVYYHMDVQSPGECYSVTNLIQKQIGADVRFLQSDTDGKLIAVNNVFTEMLSLKEMDTKKGETPPSEPVVYTTAGGYKIIWENNTSRLIVFNRAPATELQQEQWKYLAERDWRIAMEV